MQLLWILMWLFLSTSSALSDETTGQREYIDELSFEYDVTDGKLGARGKLVVRENDKSKTEFFPDYIPSDIASLCVTGNPELSPCLSLEAVPQKLQEPKTFSSIYYMWVTPTRAAIGFYVSRERIEIRDSDLNAFKTLKIVIFYNIGLKAISSNIFGDLIQMEIIQIDSNNLAKLSRNFFSDVPHLKTLSLVDNDISNIELGSFNKLPRLTELFLGHNKLDVFNLNLFYSLELNLEVLKLNNNRISKVEIKHFEANLISTDDFLLQMVELRILDLQGNQLSEIAASWISQVPHLEELNLADNQIKFIENGAFLKMKNLRILNLSNNRLKVPQAAWYIALTSSDHEGQVELQYHGNEWECDCSILEYHDFYEEEIKQMEKGRIEEDSKTTIMGLEISCFQPESLYGKLLNRETVKAINRLFSCKTDDEEIQKSTEEEVSQRNDVEESQENTDDKAYGKNDKDNRQANTASKADQSNSDVKSNQCEVTEAAHLYSRHCKTFSIQYDIYVDPDSYPLFAVLIVCITACYFIHVYFKPRNEDRQSSRNTTEKISKTFSENSDSQRAAVDPQEEYEKEPGSEISGVRQKASRAESNGRNKAEKHCSRNTVENTPQTVSENSDCQTQANDPEEESEIKRDSNISEGSQTKTQTKQKKSKKK